MRRLTVVYYWNRAVWRLYFINLGSVNLDELVF